jgi:excisionase family DNA binding protein
MPESEYVSASEAGRILGVTRVRVAQLMDAGELPFQEVNPRMRLIRRADVEKLAEQRRQAAAAPRDGAGRPPKVP